MTLSYGSPGSWSIGTVVYLAKRNDTLQPNTSPLTTGKPVYRWDVDIIYFLLKLPILSTPLPVSFSKYGSLKLNTVANAIYVCLFCYAPKITECETYYFCPVCHSLWNFNLAYKCWRFDITHGISYWQDLSGGPESNDPMSLNLEFDLYFFFKNYLADNFSTVSAKAFIFHKSSSIDKIFLMVLNLSTLILDFSFFFYWYLSYF